MSLSADSAKEILLAFNGLGLTPTNNNRVVLNAFRDKARKCHPDRFVNKIDKQRAHDEFVKHVNNRDTCINAISMYGDKVFELNDFINKPTVNYTNVNDVKVTKESTHDSEWLFFVNNENAYFSVFKSPFGVIAPFVSIVYASAWMSLVLMFGIISIAFVIMLGVSIPFLGWVGLVVFAIWAIIKYDKYIENTGKQFLMNLSKTGYPLKSFYLCWIFTNIMIVSLAILSHLYLDFELWSALILALLFLIPANTFCVNVKTKIINELEKIEKGLRDLRQRVYQLALVKS